MCYSFGTSKKGSKFLFFINIIYLDLFNTEALKIPGPGFKFKE